MEFLEKFKENATKLKIFIDEKNFRACENMSTDLLRSSDFADYSEGVFIGEFLESLFSNLRSVSSLYEVDNEDMEKMKEAIYPVIDFITEHIPLTDANRKAEFYDLIMNARCFVTEIQIIYYRERRPKRPQIQAPPSIEMEME